MTGQGITVAISQAAITAYVKGLLSPTGNFTKAIDGMTLADYPISVTNAIDVNTGQDTQNVCTNINIELSNGSISSYTPSFTSVQQQTRDAQNPTGGVFQLAFSSSGSFNANYSWVESYTAQSQYFSQVDPNDPGHWTNQGAPFPVNTPFAYSPSIGSLNTTTDFTFKFDSTNNAWDLPVTSVTATSTVASANIPSGSVLQNQDQPACVNSHVDAATQKSITNGIDFKDAIQDAVNGNLTTIPASGNLTDDIVFAFGLGDSPLTFPNDNGLTVGVTGVSTYKKQTYAGTLPTNLPVPPVPTDYHLYMYVSDYVFNGLYWAFFEDGQLTTTVQPSDVADPNVLKMSTYSQSIPVLKPYNGRAMQAEVTALQAPTVAFENVYLFTTAAMNTLKSTLSTDSYNNISGLSGNYYATQADLETDLNSLSVSSSDQSTIEGIIQTKGMVVTHDLQFTLTIEDATPINGNAPYIKFSVSRTDILTGLVLGIANSVQTLQFTFYEATSNQIPSSVATYISSNIPNFTKDYGAVFAISIWPNAGDPPYDKVLADMGGNGVPLPIMQDFRFLFDGAQLNIESGFVSILSDVEFVG